MSSPSVSPLDTIVTATKPTASEKTVPATALYVVAASVALLDQAVKSWAFAHLTMLGRDGLAVLPGIFHLTYTENRGMAFSLLEGQRFLLIGAALLVMGGIVWAQRRLGTRLPLPLAVSLGLALGGALGNGLDRARLGHVVDLFDARFIHFPIFNVADTAITFGILLLALRVAQSPAEGAEMVTPSREYQGHPVAGEGNTP